MSQPPSEEHKRSPGMRFLKFLAGFVVGFIVLVALVFGVCLLVISF